MAYVAPGYMGSYVAPGYMGSYVAPGYMGSYVAPGYMGSVGVGNYVQPGYMGGLGDFDPASLLDFVPATLDLVGKSLDFTGKFVPQAQPTVAKIASLLPQKTAAAPSKPTTSTALFMGTMKPPALQSRTAFALPSTGGSSSNTKALLAVGVLAVLGAVLYTQRNK